MRNLILAAALVASTAHADRAPTGGPLFTIMGTPTAWADRGESYADRLARVRPVALAIEHESSDEGDVAALLALGQHETLWAKRIMRDQCLPGECDNGQARGPWQIQRNACPEASAIWSQPPSPARFRLEARCALYVYHTALKKCGDGYAGGLAGYRGKCETTDKALRARTFEVFVDVGANGWPRAPKGWQRDPSPSHADRVYANQRLRELNAEPGDFFKLPSGAGVLVEYHWHEFGGDVSPRGWHTGLSLYFFD